MAARRGRGRRARGPARRSALLRRLAEATGGVFYASPADVPALSELDATRTRSLGVAELAPFASAWAFGALCALFLAEWILRRRFGRR
ncbi:MAG: hypothetical protein M5U28_09275 [Sandaracinaceae bacterium]|nr:hypothetical protein [Sandaracinaceae bacterium]